MSFDLSPILIWAIFGLILLVVEILTGSFFILFFGIASLVVSLLKKFTTLDNLAFEIIIFSIIGVCGLLIFRKKLVRGIHSRKNFESDNNKIIKLNVAIEKNSEANIEYQGSQWLAVNESETDFKIGDKARIEKIEGVKIILKQP